MPTAAPDFRVLGQRLRRPSPDRRADRYPSLLEACERHGHPHRAFVFGSTSKVTLAGAGVCAFAGSRENVTWYLGRMGKRTIGGDKVNQLRHVRFLREPTACSPSWTATAPSSRRSSRPWSTRSSASRRQGRGLVDRAQGGVLHQPRRARRLRERARAAAKGAGVGADTRGRDASPGQDPHNRKVRIAPTFPDRAEVAAAAEGVAISALLATSTALIDARLLNRA